MTSIKTNIDNIFNHKKNQPNSNILFNLNKLSNKYNNYNTQQQHQSLIQQISFKNNALTQHNQKSSLTNHPNYLTFCQKYADTLCQKYNASSLTNNSNLNSKKNQQNQQIKLLQQQQSIAKKIIICKRYFQNVQFIFDKNYQEINLKIKYLNNILQSKTQNFTSQQKQISNQLLILELFMNKINNKINKLHVTPFTLFVQEIKNKTPQKLISNYYQQDFIQNDTPQKHNHKYQNHQNHQPNYQQYQNNQKKKMFISNIVSPKTPQLLHSFKQNSKDQSNLLISFKQNLQNSQFGGQTLKYSESQLNINLDRNQISKQQKQIKKDHQDQELPYSPVQPYRLQKLQSEGLKRQDYQQNTHKTVEEQIFLQKEDILIKESINQIQSNIKKGQQKYIVLVYKMNSGICQTLGDMSQIMQKNEMLMNEQKYLMNQEWNEILDYLGKDIQQIQCILRMQKVQNDMKDRKFLQNLQVIQNELIEQIFEQKQCRKVQQGVLTRVLSNLVDSLGQSSY